MVPGGIHQRFPLLLARGVVEHQLKVYFDEPGHILGPFDITAHPVNRVSNAA
jgi:hypothetical protein